MRQVFRRVWYAIRQRRFEADLAEELEFHRAMKQRELEEGGLEPTEATFATRRALGSSALAQDHSRDVWCPLWLQGIGQDFLLAVRTLLASRIVSTVAVLSLALGIGANTAIFSLVNSLLLRTLPVRDPQQLVLMSSGTGPRIAYWSYGVWDQLRQRPQLFDGAVAWSVTRFDLSSGGETQFVDGLWANGAFFDVLGVPPWLGRTFSQADDQPGGGSNGPVAVISYGFWQRHFAAASEAIGRTLTLDRVTFTIVGVTPPDFFGADVGRTFDVAVPLGDEPLIHDRNSWALPRSPSTQLTVMARLKPGQTLEAATAALRGVQPQIRDATLPEGLPPQFLDRYLKDALTLVPAATGNSNLRVQYQRPLVTILVVVALVLLIACANVANLLLARATARRHEFSVRRALGASRWRLMRQLLMESAVLAGAGTVFGLLIASWGSQLLMRELSTQNVDAGPNATTNTVFLDLSLDWRVLAFTIGVTVATALLFGLAPALRASRVAPMDALKEHGRGTAGDARVGLASGLVVAQVALSLMLVVAAGLFARTFESLTARHLGFDREGVLLVTIDTGRANVDPTRRAALYQRAREAVLTVPGVAHAAVSSRPPVVSGPMLGQPLQEVSGGPPLPPSGRLSTLNLVSPGWFETFGIAFVAGRDITDRDRLGTPPVVVVNETFARVFLNGASPLGHTIKLFLPGPPPPPIEIVGVVGDAVYARSLREPIGPTIYLPLAQRDEVWLPFLASMNLSVRSSGGSPTLLTKSVAAAIGAVNPELALTFRPLASQIDASLTQDRVLAMLSGFFGALALLLAGLGLYGVTSYGVSRRRREIGVHIALGAAPGHVQRLVLSRVSVLVVLGVIIGGMASLWASRFVATLLYGLEPRDPATLIEAAVVLATVGALAAWLPAWRASRIDPAVVLRYE
jgi:putative ABC transport system permease protein